MFTAAAMWLAEAASNVMVRRRERTATTTLVTKGMIKVSRSGPGALGAG